MNHRQAKRTTQTPQEPPATASIIRFPRGTLAKRTVRDKNRPSLALNVVLVLLLVLACVIWEAMSGRTDSALAPRHSEMEAPASATV